MSAPTLNAGVCEGHGCAEEVDDLNVEAFELTGKVLCESCAAEAFEREAERADPAAQRRSWVTGLDALLEGYARNANQYANETGDKCWSDLALVLLGARTFTRPLMADADRKGGA